MCEDCEEAEPLRDVYLARRARMAQTWRPNGGPGKRWRVDAVAPATVPIAPQPDARPTLIAAE